MLRSAIREANHTTRFNLLPSRYGRPWCESARNRHGTVKDAEGEPPKIGCMRKPRSAFVVEADVDLAQLHGRVEHVITGTSYDFKSAGALIQFMERMLSPQPPAGDAGRTK